MNRHTQFLGLRDGKRIYRLNGNFHEAMGAFGEYEDIGLTSQEYLELLPILADINSALKILDETLLRMVTEADPLHVPTEEQRLIQSERAYINFENEVKKALTEWNRRISKRSDDGAIK